MDTWIEKLQEFKKDLTVEEHEITEAKRQREVLSSIENTNAELTEDSKAIGLNSKYIFKEFISSEKAESIIKAMSESEKVTKDNLNSFKRKLYSLCAEGIREGESPVEMLIYSTKAVQDNNLIENAVLDVLKELSVVDDRLTSAYNNILTNWTWVPQVSLVIKSVLNLNLEELAEPLMVLVEKKPSLRQQAANGIIALKQEKYYKQIVNLFTALKTDGRDVTGMILNVFINMAKSSVEGVNCILKGYLDCNNRMLDSIFIAALKNTITPENIDTIAACVTSKNKVLQKKALILLGKLQNEYVNDILFSLQDNEAVDKQFLSIAIGYTKSPKAVNSLKAIVGDNSYSLDSRTSSLISLANIGDKKEIPFIESYLGKSPEFEIAAASGLIQLGRIEMLPNIFRYILTVNAPENLVRLAVRELQRLRGLRFDAINSNLNSAARKILEKENEFMTMNVLNVLTRGIDNEVAEILMEKLSKTKIEGVKLFILDYFGKNFNELNEALRGEIREAFVQCSEKGNPRAVIEAAMKGLKIVNRNNDFTPVKEGA